MLTFSSLSLRRGTRLLIADVSFTIHRAEKVGIVGANGCGKSSLLALILGELQPDAGSFELPPQRVIAHVAQELAADECDAIEFVMDGDRELRAIQKAIADAEANDAGALLGELHGRLDAIGGYEARSRAGRLMHGLGFTAADETRPVDTFSGGWRVRLNLARALMCRSDLLLLDEPTNHLDLDAVIWLEEWLRTYPGTLLMIAHDREFLDRTVGRIVHIEAGTARLYSGNYSAFEEQRAAQLAQQRSMYERQQRQIRHMMSFVERFRAKATKARQAQSRLKALERMERIAPAHVDSPFEFSFLSPQKLPRPLLTLEKQSAGYGERRILESISMTIAPGNRIALLGRNGAGKSTLMKLLAGELPDQTGRRTEARDLRIGYFAQHQLEQLTPDDSPLMHLRRLGADTAARAAERELRGFLGGFGFSGDRVFEPVGLFSGGEKARLVLALVSYQRPNLLLLDEPTNHLDLEMRQALAIALQDYEAAVVLVSHDRHLLRAVADDLILVDQGQARPFEGDLDDYARWSAAREPSTGEAPTPSCGKAARPGTGRGANLSINPSMEQKKQRKRAAAQRRSRIGPLLAEIARIENRIQALEMRRKELEASLASSDVYAAEAKTRLQELLQSQTQLIRDIDAQEISWLEANERLEAELAADLDPADIQLASDTMLIENPRPANSRR
ncbi:ABC transporter ATP-binding protein [Steroidobacter denitrificans]|uniref:Probable ATP-binding protein YheS n=1 Tax=Steroidobacter denitrificans TaxID=465721 RepID=A0A127FE70_STEDE|nr:ATP-binding cassette domain-containing protein [Steroidobacter denitrificans]AMN48190.1 ABC transporter ATP-binding protein [Steroidobacter denitrificans]